jgi:ribosomal protein S18 acetylase RimI-like enzyme
MPADTEMEFRTVLRDSDPLAIGELVAATGFFSLEEQHIAVELVEERIEEGPRSGYEFVIAEQNGALAGYTCYGRIAGTSSSYDLYWIAVRPDLQGRGLGRRLLEQSEQAIREARGTRVYVDTSSRAQYEPTRAFYERSGYERAAVLDDFYAPGDGKIIYAKALTKDRDVAHQHGPA